VTPVKQRYKHDPDNGTWGDCHRAAIASLLDLPLDAVPHWADQGAAIGDKDEKFLNEHGYSLITQAFDGSCTLEQILNACCHNNPGSYFILGGTSKNGTGHSVIAHEFKIVHDPSLDDSGIVGPMSDGLWWVQYLGAARFKERRT
jgi:hypothetical protein